MRIQEDVVINEQSNWEEGSKCGIMSQQSIHKSLGIQCILLIQGLLTAVFADLNKSSEATKATKYQDAENSFSGIHNFKM